MKKIKLILLSLICATSLSAQYVEPSAEDKAKGKEVNSIKKSGDACYSDVYVEAGTESEALTEAEQKSMDLMKAHVIEIFGKRFGMSKKDVQDIWAVIEANCKHVVIKRGDLYRIFTYVMKEKFIPGYEPNAPAPEPEPKPEPTPEPKPEPKPEPTPIAVASITVDKVQMELTEGDSDKLIATINPADAANKKMTWSSSNPDVVAVGQDGKVEALKEGSSVVSVVAEDGGKKAVCEVTVKAKPAPELPPTPAPEVVIPELCQKLIATKNFDGLMAFLKKEKAANKLMWGNANRLQRHELCYIVALDRVTKEIVAVLDKGKAERMNFMNKKMEHARIYRGTHSCVFVQEY